MSGGPGQRLGPERKMAEGLFAGAAAGEMSFGREEPSSNGGFGRSRDPEWRQADVTFLIAYGSGEVPKPQSGKD